MKFPVFAAALCLCLAACVNIDENLGGSMIPVGNTYKVVTQKAIPIGVSQQMADSLSGFSTSRITIGSIRKDDEFGLTTRSSVVTLIPLFNSKHDMGTDRIFKSMHFATALDSVSVEDKSQINILQGVNVYEVLKTIDYSKDFDCNGDIPHGSERISDRIPHIGASDSLSFDFSSKFGEKYMNMTDDDRSSYDKYVARFPGIYLETTEPLGEGGRINIFKLQLGYSSESGGVTGNYAQLNYSAVYDGVRKDTSALFYYSATGFYDLDSLAKNSGTGSFPQYCLNLTGHQYSKSRGLAGPAHEEVMVEGGGGLKPVVSAREIRESIISAIAANGDDPSKAIINRATLHFNFVKEDLDKLYKLPEVLSPTCRIRGDSTVSFMGLTDSSASEENQGDRNLSLYTFTPDITYHAQKLVTMDSDDESLVKGNYDIWLLIMHNDLTQTTSSGNSEISQYYQYLAYQSYMGNMYGGYGYGGYGYGYGNSYTNYYNYAMLAQMYGQSTTSTSTSRNLDRDRYYSCRLYGPECPDTEMRPALTFTYSVPNDE